MTARRSDVEIRLRSLARAAAVAVLCCCGAVMAPAARGGQTSPTLSASEASILPPQKGETLSLARAEIQKQLASVRTVRAVLELSKKDKKGRKVKSGPLELARQRGARVALTRKEKTEEYIATPEVIWSYDHKDKEAQYIPTSLPVISTFVQSAMSLDLLLALTPDSMKLLGSGMAEGEPCWVIEGKSPDTLEVLGVPVVKIRVWVARRDGVPRRISLPKEKDTLLVLRNVEVNGAVGTERFQWTPPHGVKTKNIFGF